MHPCSNLKVYIIVQCDLRLNITYNTPLSYVNCAVQTAQKYTNSLKFYHLVALSHCWCSRLIHGVGAPYYALSQIRGAKGMHPCTPPSLDIYIYAHLISTQTPLIYMHVATITVDCMHQNAAVQVQVVRASIEAHFVAGCTRKRLYARGSSEGSAKLDWSYPTVLQSRQVSKSYWLASTYTSFG